MVISIDREVDITKERSTFSKPSAVTARRWLPAWSSTVAGELPRNLPSTSMRAVGGSAKTMSCCTPFSLSRRSRLAMASVTVSRSLASGASRR